MIACESYNTGVLLILHPLGWQVTCVPPYVRRPFSSTEHRQISDRDDHGPPVVPEGLGSRNLRPRRRHVPPRNLPQDGGTSHGARRFQGAARSLGRTDGCLRPLVAAKACHMAKRSVGVEYSPSYAGARAHRGGVTRQGVVLTDLQSLLDCQ
jgi:hypothetical protein